MSIVVLEKPRPIVSVADWHNRIWELGITADSRRAESLKLRAQGRLTRNETAIQTKWDGIHSDARLRDRVSEISRWKEVLQRSLTAVKKEMDLLKDEKNLTDKALEHGTNIPLFVVNECMTLRDQRKGNDLNHDDVYVHLKRELAVIEDLKADLIKMCLSAWEQGNRLQDEYSSLLVDFQDKETAFQIDNAQLETEPSCASTSYKPDPTRVPTTCIPILSWVEHTRFNTIRAGQEISESQILREKLFCARERARNNLMAQHEATNFALRRRIYQLERANTELEWQRAKMVTEMEKIDHEIAELEVALNLKTDVSKQTETRLEMRLWRPARELVHDDAQTTLTDQILSLRASKQELVRQIMSCRESFNISAMHLKKIDDDISDKKHSLMINLRCNEVRKGLLTGDRAPPVNETERNIKLTRTELEKMFSR